MRVVSLGGLTGPIVFAAAVVIAAQLRPDYSHVHNFVSELAATRTPNAAAASVELFARHEHPRPVLFRGARALDPDA